MADLTNLEILKINIREADIPYFEDSELNYHLAENEDDIRKASYQCLIIKSEDSTINVSGLKTSDTSSYFKRLASKYKPRNSGILGG